jgi:hypothetical protein
LWFCWEFYFENKLLAGRDWIQTRDQVNLGQRVVHFDSRYHHSRQIFDS